MAPAAATHVTTYHYLHCKFLALILFLLFWVSAQDGGMLLLNTRHSKSVGVSKFGVD